jgi:hypothetical protein
VPISIRSGCISKNKQKISAPGDLLAQMAQPAKYKRHKHCGNTNDQIQPNTRSGFLPEKMLIVIRNQFKHRSCNQHSTHLDKRKENLSPFTDSWKTRTTIRGKIITIAIGFWPKPKRKITIAIVQEKKIRTKINKRIRLFIGTYFLPTHFPGRTSFVSPFSIVHSDQMIKNEYLDIKFIYRI